MIMGKTNYGILRPKEASLVGLYYFNYKRDLGFNNAVHSISISAPRGKSLTATHLV